MHSPMCSVLLVSCYGILKKGIGSSTNRPLKRLKPLDGVLGVSGVFGVLGVLPKPLALVWAAAKTVGRSQNVVEIHNTNGTANIKEGLRRAYSLAHPPAPPPRQAYVVAHPPAPDPRPRRRPAPGGIWSFGPDGAQRPKSNIRIWLHGPFSLLGVQLVGCHGINFKRHRLIHKGASGTSEASG